MNRHFTEKAFQLISIDELTSIDEMFKLKLVLFKEIHLENEISIMPIRVSKATKLDHIKSLGMMHDIRKQELSCTVVGSVD